MNFFFKIKNKLSIIYALYTFIISSIIIFAFYIYTAGILEKNNKELLMQTCEKIDVKLDTLLNSMDSTCLQVIGNSDVQRYLSRSNQYSGGYNYFDFYDREELLNILTSINSPMVNNVRISVFDKKMNFLTVGSLGHDEKAFYQNYDKYATLSGMDRENRQFIIYPPHQDNWVSREPIETVFAFVRMIPNIASTTEILGYVEIEQPYSMIEDACSFVTDESITVTILDSNNQVIYPYNTLSPQEIKHYIEIKEMDQSYSNHLSEGEENSYQKTIEEYGWTILLTQNAADFYQPVRLLQQLLILFIVVFNGFSIIIIYMFTKRITQPITDLRESIESLSSTNPHIQLEGNNYHNEIVMLKDAFNNAFEKMNHAMQETVIANRNQVKAHILAMQSQMNPHFLFNTLMAISGIAEAQEDYKVVFICEKLSNMLRYISSFKDSMVSLQDELEYTVNYLELMKVRYEDFLIFEMDIEAENKQFPIPKLVIQPIVENCFTHGFKNTEPPYRIQIKSRTENDFLILQVYDNGEGFSEFYQSDFKKKIEFYKERKNIQDYIHSSELGGLGLINIYLRLQLRYGKEVQMELNNDEKKGCMVEIKVPAEKE